jgi:hypothetical protein
MVDSIVNPISLAWNSSIYNVIKTQLTSVYVTTYYVCVAYKIILFGSKISNNFLCPSLIVVVRIMADFITNTAHLL